MEHSDEVGRHELAEQPRDLVDVRRRAQFLELEAQTLAHLPPEAGGVEELHQPLPVLYRVGARDPDTGVVELFRRQREDSFDLVVLQHVVPDRRLVRTGTLREQRRVIRDRGCPGLTRRRGPCPCAPSGGCLSRSSSTSPRTVGATALVEGLPAQAVLPLDAHIGAEDRPGFIVRLRRAQRRPRRGCSLSGACPPPTASRPCPLSRS